MRLYLKQLDQKGKTITVDCFDSEDLGMGENEFYTYTDDLLNEYLQFDYYWLATSPSSEWEKSPYNPKAK